MRKGHIEAGVLLTLRHAAAGTPVADDFQEKEILRDLVFDVQRSWRTSER